MFKKYLVAVGLALSFYMGVGLFSLMLIHLNHYNMELNGMCRR